MMEYDPVERDVLDLGKSIARALKDIGASIYPLVPDVNAGFPLITYQRTDLTELSSEDNYCHEATATYDIVIAARDYEESVQLARSVRAAMRSLDTHDITMDVHPVLISGSEGAERDGSAYVYLQFLTYKITIE